MQTYTRKFVIMKVARSVSVSFRVVHVLQKMYSIGFLHERLVHLGEANGRARHILQPCVEHIGSECVAKVILHTKQQELQSDVNSTFMMILTGPVGGQLRERNQSSYGETRPRILESAGTRSYFLRANSHCRIYKIWVAKDGKVLIGAGVYEDLGVEKRFI